MGDYTSKNNTINSINKLDLSGLNNSEVRKVFDFISFLEHKNRINKTLGTEMYGKLNQDNPLDLAARYVGYDGEITERNRDDIKLAIKIALELNK